MHEEFNPASFLNYFDFPSEEALIERIIELDKDDAKYLEVMRQPYCHNNQPNEFFNTGPRAGLLRAHLHDADPPGVAAPAALLVRALGARQAQ